MISRGTSYSGPNSTSHCGTRGGSDAGPSLGASAIGQILREERISLLADEIADAERRLDKLRRRAADELFVAIAVETAGAAFSSRELWMHTRDIEALAPPLRARFAALRCALDTARLRSAVHIGVFLRRVQMRTVGGIWIEAIGEDRDGKIWIIRSDANDPHLRR